MDQAVAHPDPGSPCTAACSQPWVPIGVAEPDTSVTVLVVDSDEESDTEDEECERCVRFSLLQIMYSYCTLFLLTVQLQVKIATCKNSL